jgi:hypothetical protein|tara:strand:+ start:725 stop:4069 length:3345 start_codon:yes stop_codon:yes gene_type:complete
MSNIWTNLSGVTLANLEESITAIVNLPISDNASVTTKLISGELPEGLRLKDNQIVGTPNPVPRSTTSTFVIRATTGSIIEDRTYKIVVEGADEPIWATPEGNLSVGGENKRYFVLDNEIIHFQLQATDLDMPAGQQLEYFINKGDGELPSGITMSRTGLISGVVDPLLALDVAASKGAYDTNTYDGYAFDFTSVSSYYYNGEFFPDAVFKAPKKLNRYYQFAVSVNDGDTIVKRQFTIYVVGDDFLRADNVLMQVGTGVFTSDNTYLRTPVWLTNSDIGYRRADNYITIFLDVLKNNLQQGVTQFVLKSNNPDASASTLPPGMTLDASTGEVAGRIPYQPSVTKEYKFTVTANLVDGNTIASSKDRTFTVKILGDVDSTIEFTSNTVLGTIDANFISVFRVEATSSVTDAPLIYTKTAGRLPPGLSLQFDGEITGKVQQFGEITPTIIDGLTIFDNGLLLIDGGDTTVDRSYTFTVEAKDRFGYSAVTKQFTINILDENDLLYSNLYMKPFMDQELRASYRGLISNPNIFPANVLYRPNDSEFGLQKEVKILAYAGLETKSLDTYFASSQKYHKKRRYKVGNVKTALAKTPGTDNTVYEIVYAEVIDPAEPTKGKTAKNFKIKNSKSLTVDQVSIWDTNGREHTNSGMITLKGGDEIFNKDPLINSSKFRPFDRFLDVYGIKLVGTPAIGGARANSNEFILKVARTVTLLLDSTYGGSTNPTKQMAVINRMKENKTAQKIGWQGPSSYTPSITADNAVLSYEGLEKFQYTYNSVDYIWEHVNESLNGDSAILEVLEHLIHTITVYGLSENDALNQQNQTSALYLAMVEAINNNMFDISGYSGTFPGTDADFRALLMREYLYLLVLGEWNYITEFIPGGSLQPEWHDNMRTPEGISAVDANPLGHALYTTHILPVITKPSKTMLRQLFQDNDLGVSGYEPNYVTSGVDESDKQYYFPTNDMTLAVGDKVVSSDQSSLLTAIAETDSQNFNQGIRENIPLSDSDAILVSGGDDIRHISNITNMRESLEATGQTTYGFLPLWMRTPQSTGTQESGFTLAIPLCYCKPGKSAEILANVRNSKFDFKTLDIEVDRYIVDSTTGDSNEQYILFANYGYNA